MASQLSQYHLLNNHGFEMSSLKCTPFFYVLGLFLDFIFNANDLFWANTTAAFFHPTYSYFKIEHFAFGDILEYKEMLDIA